MGMTTVEVTDPRQDKAKVIDDLWQKLSFERKEWLEKGFEARRYVTATSTATTEVGSLPWKNKTTIPKLTQISDNLQSFYMAALMPSNDWFRWEGSDAASHEKANLIEAYMQTKIRMGGFRKALEQIVNDWVMHGNCFAGVKWERENTKSNITGEEIANFVGAKLYRVSPLDCVIDKRAPSFDASPFIRRYYINITDLTDDEAFDQQGVQDALTLRRNTRSDWTDYYKERGYEMDGFQSYSDYFHSQYVEMLEFWGDIFVAETGEVLRNRKITVAERAFVLEDIENPSWNGKKPFAHCGWRVVPDNLYGQGPLDNLVGMQYRCDHLENLKADTFDQIVHPIVVVKGDEVEDFEWGPGLQIHTGVDGDVTVLRPDATVLQADTQIAIYHNLMEQMAGSPREMMGFRTPGEKTAFEVNVLQQGGDRMFQDKLNRLEERLISRILNIMFEMSIRNLDTVDLARTFNDDTRALGLVELTKEDIVADGLLRPVGAKHFSQRMKRIQELQNFLALMDVPQIAPHMSGYQAAVAFTEELGFEKYGIVKQDVAVEEQMMTQQKAQQLQQEMQQEASPDETEQQLP